MPGKNIPQTVAKRNPQPVRTASATQVSIQASYSGPLPPPGDLERYNNVVPGMAERLLAKFEQQSDHRMALESNVINADVARANLGLRLAFVFGVLVLIGSIYLIVNGHEGAGVVGLLATFLTYGGAFLYGSETRRRERNKKAGV